MLLRGGRVLILLLGLPANSCVFSPCVGCHDFESRSYYSLPTAPESLITNLQVSYRNREIEHYAQILAPEFIFQFQPVDANQIGAQYFTHDQDSTGTRALLTTTTVSQIRINLIYARRDSSVNLIPPVDSLKVRIITTDLQVDQTDGMTWVVNGQQDLFFRKGRTERGENPNHWFIYEWDELPSVGSQATAIGTTTWGTLKSKYAS